jgi:hypothetical protein
LYVNDGLTLEFDHVHAAACTNFNRLQQPTPDGHARISSERQLCASQLEAASVSSGSWIDTRFGELAVTRHQN